MNFHWFKVPGIRLKLNLVEVPQAPKEAGGIKPQGRGIRITIKSSHNPDDENNY